MNDYYSVRIDCTPCNQDITDLAAAFLADAGFESFEPDDRGLTAYIKADSYNNIDADGKAENDSDSRIDKIVKDTLADFPIPVDFRIESTIVKGQDWNEEWEKHYFKPILIGNECVIHSSFHKDVPNARYDILIDPKMAFGTGHHDTTSQMVSHILASDMKGKSVIDMGTGTGILAILAKMRGAADTFGIEIDKPAYDNAVENARLNNVDINLIHGDASALENIAPTDYLFANINRNIILNDIASYASRLKKGGTMLLSGFYEEDVPMIEEAAAGYGLKETGRLVSNRWTALRLLRIED